MPKERRKESLRLGFVIVLCAGAVPAGAQTYVGNNFASGSSLLGALLTDGSSDQYPPLVILQEYSPSGPATSGAIFDSAGTVNDALSTAEASTTSPSTLWRSTAPIQ
jgi:hypothetical protein